MRLLIVSWLGLMFVSGPSYAQSLYEFQPLNQPAEGIQLTFALEEASTKAPSQDTISVALPLIEGRYLTEWVYAPIVASELAIEYPQIRTYLIIDPVQNRQLGRASWTPAGIHAMYEWRGETWYLDPFPRDPTRYGIYRRTDLDRKVEARCHHPASIFGAIPKDEGQSTNELRTYRIAVAATAEYTAYHGGELGALAAIVQTINRVNAIYERDLATRFELVANNDQLIFTDSITDPYDNLDVLQRLNANPTTLDAVVGNGNYDLGHVFATAGGGLASLASACDSTRKARGTSGRPQPNGDAFDVDIVAHEIGHQLGANHTFNGLSDACTPLARNASTAFEPGSGSTIMGYPGICGINDLQANSDGYFHAASLREMLAYTRSGPGSTCGQTLTTLNIAPILSVDDTLWVIPVETPFQLKANAIDPNGDDMSFTWEQFDLGPGGDVVSPQGNAPIMRSFGPDSSTIRYIPRLTDLVQSRQTFGEQLANYERRLQFRLTARDNSPVGGCVEFADVALKVSESAGPFEVSLRQHNWTQGGFARIDWQVADTDKPPVDCQWVDLILLDTNGVIVDTLAQRVSNKGQYAVKVPALNADHYRLMVAAADHVFFAVSSQNISVQLPPDGFDLLPMTDTLLVCEGTHNSLNVLTTALGGYNGNIAYQLTTLPPGLSVVLDSNDFQLGDTLRINAQAGLGLSPGDYGIDLSGTGDNGFVLQKSFVISVKAQALPAPGRLVLPVDGALEQSIRPVFRWRRIPDALQYEWELSSSPGFVDASRYTTIDTAYQPLLPLDSQAVYFWRVRAINQCFVGAYSLVRSFQTSACVYQASEDVPVPIPDFGTVRSEISTQWRAPLSSIRLFDLRGSHGSINEVSIELENPQGVSAFLTISPCSTGEADFDMGFADDASPGSLDCPPIEHKLYRPFEPLSKLISGSPSPNTGTWELSILDQIFGQSGSLVSWGLELCGPENPTQIQHSAQPLRTRPQTTEVLQSINLQATATGLFAEDIQYTLVSLPEEGTLSLDGSTLILGNRFDQAQLDAGRVSYQHTGLVTTDSFRYVVSAPHTQFVGTPTFYIQVWPLSIARPKELQLTVYPNPVRDMLTIESEEDALNGTATLYNLAGQLIIQEKLNGAKSHKLDLPDVLSGMYRLSLRTLKGDYHQLIICL